VHYLKKSYTAQINKQTAKLHCKDFAEAVSLSFINCRKEIQIYSCPFPIALGGFLKQKTEHDTGTVPLLKMELCSTSPHTNFSPKYIFAISLSN